MNDETDSKISANICLSNNHTSKKDIKADNFKKSKVLEVKLQNLSRVDSQNDPVVTENLDLIAEKMGLNQKNSNKSYYQSTEALQVEQSTENTGHLSNTAVNPHIDEEPKKITEHYKKSSLMVKILRRLSKPSIFSKDKKQKKIKNKSSPDNTIPSLSSDNKSNTVGENINHLTPRPRSFRNIFSRFGKGKSKNNMLSDPPSSIESRPSVSSAINPLTNIDTLGSCCDVEMDKIFRESLEKYNSPSVDCILSHRIRRPLKNQESVSSNSEDLRDHEKKMNSSNNNVISIFTEDLVHVDKSQEMKGMAKADEDKLSPLKLNITSSSVDNDRSCHSEMSIHTHDTSSNVKLTLSLHGYSAYGLSSSRFSSKSCMEFRSANISPKSKVSIDNLATYADNLEFNEINKVINENSIVLESKDNHEEELTKIGGEAFVNKCSNGVINDNEVEGVVKETDVVLRKSERPSEIQLRRSRVASQSSMARSSLIIVAVAHNTPRSKGVSNHVSTPVYNPDSPMFPCKKIEFDEERKSIEEEQTVKNVFEKDGNDFLLIANKYEEEIKMKIEIVQNYLKSSDIIMNDEVVGELNTAVGLAKLLLSEKFVQFRGLCDQNLNEPSENEFKTFACDLEGYLTTLVIQMSDLDKNFQMVEKIRVNNWQMPMINVTSNNIMKKRQTKSKLQTKLTPVDNKRAQEAKKRLAEFKKISATSNNGPSNLFIIQ